MNKKYHINERKFLNRQKDMSAHIIAIVEDTSKKHNPNDDGFYYGELDLMLSDCSRKITYDFCLCDKEGRESALYKIRLIAETINAFKEALEKECEIIEAFEKSKEIQKAKTAKA